MLLLLCPCCTLKPEGSGFKRPCPFPWVLKTGVVGEWLLLNYLFHGLFHPTQQGYVLEHSLSPNFAKGRGKIFQCIHNTLETTKRESPIPIPTCFSSCTTTNKWRTVTKNILLFRTTYQDEQNCSWWPSRLSVRLMTQVTAQLLSPSSSLINS